MIRFSPPAGTILRCDFSGLKIPEMTKIRPVVVVSPRRNNKSSSTLIVVPLSTTAPLNVMPHHLKVTLPGENIPQNLEMECWIKCDMLYSLSLERMDFYRLPRRVSGERSYYKSMFLGNEMSKIRAAIAYAIGFKL